MEGVVRRQTLHDFGHYRQQLHRWDTEAIQLSRGPLSIGFDCLDAGDLVLSRLTYDRDATMRSARNPGWRTLVMALSPKRWCGIDLPADSFVTVAPRRETRIVSREYCDAIHVTVQCDALATWEAPLAQLADWDPAPEYSILSADPHGIAAFKGWVENLFNSAMPLSPDDETPLWTAAIREEVRRHLLRILGHRVSARPVSSIQRVARYDLVLTALRQIRPETEHRTTVMDLAFKLGVSVRALEYAFVAVVGISPAQYLLAERLNRARHRLWIEGPDGGSVTTVAFDHQFENLSRFAQHYTRLFGERPSDTLRAARASVRHA